MGLRYSVLLLVFIFVSRKGYSQGDWVLRKEKEGIAVYDLKTEGSKFNSIKVETELIGRVEDLVTILMDVESHDKWAYGTKSATPLKRISDKEIIFYKVINSPGLVVSDRDLVIRLKITPDTDSNDIIIESIAIPDFIPPKQNLVRVPFSNETWTVTPLTPEKLKIKYILQVDPGGALPPLLVNLFVTKGPYETFSNLKELLKNKTN